MAFGTEGWRKIVVEERVYFWQTDEWAAYLFHIRPEQEPHRLLRVRGGQCGASGWSLQVTPGVVRAAIECAIKNAWLEERPQMRLFGFSNPLRYVSAQPCWLTRTVVALASGIYAERAFDRMPILADALQDAGCDNAEILEHCRSEDPHVLGCWVVDLVLGKT
jgi:hypothetical protein